jgi:hypothetical protein
MESTPCRSFISLLTKRQPIGGVEHPVDAAEGALGLGHDEGRTGHALDPTGDQQLHLAALDGTRGDADGVHARAAQAVDRRPRHLEGQPGKEQRHAGDIAVVLAGLVGAAVDHVADGLPVDSGIAVHQRLQRHRAQVIGAHRCERAAIAAERGADRVAQESLWVHEGLR